MPAGWKLPSLGSGDTAGRAPVQMPRGPFLDIFLVAKEKSLCIGSGGRGLNREFRDLEVSFSICGLPCGTTVSR